MKYLFTTFFVSLMIISSNTSVFWATWELENTWSITISDLKNDINTLNQSSYELSQDLKLFNANDRLKSFFKNNLSLEDLEQLESIIWDYIIKRKDVNVSLADKVDDLKDIDDEKNELLLLKRDLYKLLLPYIDKAKTLEYIEFVESDARLLKQRKDVTSEIINKQEQLNTRVWELEEKIKSYNKTLSDTLEKVIADKIKEKLDFLRNNKKFKALNKNSKLNVLNKTIDKIRFKIDELEEEYDKSEALERKIEIYIIVLDEIIEFKNQIKETY